MRPKARIGVIGSGWWGTEYHLPAVLDHPDAELAAICDNHPERLEKAAAIFQPAAVYSDYQEMVGKENLDGAIIVTPHATHFPIAKTCQELGLHLLIEKPMTLFADQARQLVETAKAKQLTLMVGYPYHFYPHTLQARQAVQSGELGPVQYVVCSFASNVIGFLQGKISPDYAPIQYHIHAPSENYNRPDLLGGGQGHLQITHSAALMLFITGLRVNQVHALMNKEGLVVDMVDAMAVQFEGGAAAVVGGTANSGSAYNVMLSIYCQNGAYISDSLARKADLHLADGKIETIYNPGSGNDRFAVTKNFIDVILGRAENGSPGEIGWRTVELLDAAYRSAAKNGQAVKIDSLYEPRRSRLDENH